MSATNGEERTVIFLGAGASAAEGAPVQSNLFREYFTYYRGLPKDKIEHEWDRELATFFSFFYGIDVDNDELSTAQFPSFEEILGILEIADSQEESFRDWGTSNIVDGRHKPRIQHIHDLLILMIAEILDAKLMERCEFHRRLVRNLDNLGLLGRTSFVSLNYDILIDNALIDLHPDWDIDYRIDFSNYDEAPSPTSPEMSWHRPDKDKSIQLLKLHGSLNWLFCPTCRTLQLTPKEKGVCKLKWRPEECVCQKCSTLTVPIIIPPTYFKVLSNIYLRQIWHITEQVLFASDRVVFCGYSFPEADIHVRYLLKRIEVNRQSTPEVYVVNHETRKDPAQSSSERQRYSRFFCQKSNVHWTNLSFEDFAGNPTLIKDRTRWV